MTDERMFAAEAETNARKAHDQGGDWARTMGRGKRFINDELI